MSFGKGLASLVPPRDDDANKSINETPQPTAGNIPVVEETHLSITEEEPIKIEPSVDIPTPTQSPSPQIEPKESVNDFVKKTEDRVVGNVFQIEVDRIKPNPNQPRRDFDEDALRELAASIREFGVLQPLIVSKIEKETDSGWSVYYELVAGERRLMAAKMAGLHTVPVIVRKESGDREKLELAVIENIQRADLNPIEFARAIARLQDEFGLTQREIAVRLSKSREAIANSVRLLGLPSAIQDAVAEGKITESHARLLLSIEDPALQNEVFEDILKYGLSVREAEARMRHGRGVSTKTTMIRINPEVEALKSRLEEFLGTKVDLQSKGTSGKISISFYSPDELEAIVEKVVKQNDSQFPLPPLES